MRDDAWMDAAPCKLVDGEIFHSEDDKNINRAKMVCVACPFTKECLRWAIETKNHGVAAGLTAKERRKIGKQIEAGRFTLNEWANRPIKITLRKPPKPVHHEHHPSEID